MTGRQQVNTIGHMLSFGVGRTATTQKMLRNILGNIWATEITATDLTAERVVKVNAPRIKECSRHQM